MERHIILRIITKALVPPIMLFALYVQFHGDFGPGGGFQAGVIFGSAFILYGLLFGVMQVQEVVSPLRVRQLAAGGVLIYAGVGVATLLLGGNYLDYDVLSDDPVAGQHLGILLIELGVGVTVAATMITLFYAFRKARLMFETFGGHFNYYLVVVLIMVGLYMVMANSNLIKKIVGLSVFQTGVFILYISAGKVAGGSAPIASDQITVYSNPLPHVLILTAIVVGVATTSLALALAVRIHETYGSIEEDDINAADAESES